jgi:nucleoside-triphosphatase THEP1
LEVGRFRFSRTAFEKADQIIRNSIEGEGWLIIDEIGPLELKGGGFAAVLRELITQRRKNLVIVVREGMVNEVQEKFGIVAREIRDPGEIR